MLSVASLLAAMTIAGAFWVGVLAARRLRDWGEGRRALEEGGQAPLAIAAVSGAPPDDARTRRVRELVASRIQGERRSPVMPRARELVGEAGARGEGLGLSNLRGRDVVSVDAADAIVDGDYIVEGVVLLREGGRTTTVVNMADGSRHRWLVGAESNDRWLLVEPVTAHGVSGEPPRNIRRPAGEFTLARRGQASAACFGRHERPDTPRAATYVYDTTSRDVLWLERWGHEVLMGEGRYVEPSDVSFLPGS